ncbi:MAG TPA: dihydrolipoamide acetyltransferase family protein, partial [Candidatus Solibacter sp.]|nr:dihydrolipoamide acetyltransferase family protein [Candidatus Solibacter sp.]
MTDVVMPQMGESIVEGTLTKWLKKAGDRIERDEPLFEISTDKVDTEIPAPAAGTLSEILVPEGQTVGINTVVARIDEGGGAAAKPAAPAAKAAKPAAKAEEPTADAAEPEPEAAEPAAKAEEPAADAAEPKPEAAEPAAKAAKPAAAPAAPPAAKEQAAPPEPEPEATEPPQPTPALEQVDEPLPVEPAGPLSPLVRKMARENNIDLARVRGTGAGGRITKQDLEAHLAGSAKPAAPAPAPATPPAAPATAPAARPAAPVAPPAAPPAAPAPAAPPAMAPLGAAGQAKTRIEPMSTMRIKIAEHMVMSKRTSPHVTTVHRVDMTKAARLRELHKAAFQSNYGFSLTYLPFIVRASAVALRQFPLLNASLDGNNIVYHNEINVGIAVALENGLIVPVIRGADEKN